ncbi:MAG: hypothetical protein LBK25_02365 [Treponema sp.]|nr:hypothetical protein [Treponema sp.]
MLASVVPSRRGQRYTLSNNNHCEVFKHPKGVQAWFRHVGVSDTSFQTTPLAKSSDRLACGDNVAPNNAEVPLAKQA